MPEAKTEKNLGIPAAKGMIVSSSEDVSIREQFPCFFYEVKEKRFSEKETDALKYLRQMIFGKSAEESLSSSQKPKELSAEFLKKFKNEIVHEIELADALRKIPETELVSALEMDLLALVKENLKFVSDSKKFVRELLDSTIGYGFLGVLMRDGDLEEVMVNGFEKPVFVVHRRYGMCITNLLIKKDNFVLNLIHRIALTASKEIDTDAPLLDARLPDGNRANATLPYSTPFGPTLTVRKFSVVPLSVIELIENKTINSELAAFFWVMVEGLNIEPMNVIITGGAGSGKTTTLNALASFVRDNERIVTIEDTLELHLGSKKNWISMEAKPATRKIAEVTMDDLLKNSLRMRPDRIILGEVRGPEALTLFTAMDIGHKGIMGTIHSNSGREALLRLKSHPMNVPEIMLPLLDLVIVQFKAYVRGQGVIRRISYVSEIGRMEDKALLADIYHFDQKTETIEKTGTPSHILEKLSEKTSLTKKDVMREITLRQRILEWMLRNNVKTTPEVEKIIQEYYYNPEKVISTVLGELPKQPIT